MRLFLSAASFLPEYGGPAFSISRLALALAEVEVRIGLWAPDGSAISSSLVAAHPLVLCLDGKVPEAFDHFGRADAIHDNGIWLPHNHRLAVLSRRHDIPRLVSLRGMLEPWAMDHKKWKKGLAWTVYQRRDLQSAQCHHATAESEAEIARRHNLGVPIGVVPNGMDLPELKEATAGVSCPQRRTKIQKTALFLGRIHPVKGLPMLVEAWARVQPHGWVLWIAGPDEAGHRSAVEQLVSRAGLGDAVSFLGSVANEAKAAVYSAADLFVLPTHSENFGMSVAEALAHGVPVLTTKRAPWRMLIEHNCGWWVEPTIDGICQGVREATSTSQETRKEMGLRGRALIAREFAWDMIARRFVDIYKELSAK